MIAIIGSSLEKFALEIRGLQKTEIGEVEEPFGKGQKGSSAMPHKRNPIGCEQIVGLARLLRGNAGAALENNALWHERDISHSSVERVIVPDSFIALDHMLRRFTRIVTGMVVYADRMRENLERSRGVVFSGTVLLELARHGVSREQSYEWVQRNAMRSFHERQDFKALLLADADVTRVLTPAEIERAFDLNDQLKHVDDVFERVFQEVAVLCRLAYSSPSSRRCSTLRAPPSLKPSTRLATTPSAMFGKGSTSSSRSTRRTRKRLVGFGECRPQAVVQSRHRELSHRGDVVKIAVVVLPGSNCDHDTYYVAKDVLGQDAELIGTRTPASVERTP